MIIIKTIRDEDIIERYANGFLEVKIELTRQELYDAYSKKKTEYDLEDIKMRIEENQGRNVLHGMYFEEVISVEEIMYEIHRIMDNLDVDESYWYGIDSCIDCGIQNILEMREKNG